MRWPRLRPRALEFEFSDYWDADDTENSLNMVQVSAIDRENVPGFVEQFAPIDQIELLMMTGSASMTARQIYEELGMSVSFNEVKKALARGKAEGTFVAMAGNRFGLAARSTGR